MAKADDSNGGNVFPFTGQRIGFGSGNDSQPPGGDPLEARVAKLESDVEYIKADISTLKADVKTISRDIIDVKLNATSMDGRLKNIEQNMVTKGQLATYALVTLIAICGGGWWIVQQYLAPILKALPK